MSFLDGLYNDWALYWPPPTVDKFGNATTWSTPTAIRVNWKRGGTRAIKLDGEDFIPNHTVFAATELAAGGYLERLNVGPQLTQAQADALKHNDPAPVSMRIRMVTMQNDMDKVSDKVYNAIL